MIDSPYEIMISYFDMHIGPNVLFSNIGSKNSEEDSKYNISKEEILQFMDIHDPGDFFVHYFNQILSVNYIFSIEDPDIRGGEHQLMTSMLFPKINSSITDEKYLNAIFSNISKFKTEIKEISSTINKNTLMKMLLKSSKALELGKNPHFNEIKSELTRSLTRKIRIN